MSKFKPGDHVKQVSGLNFDTGVVQKSFPGVVWVKPDNPKQNSPLNEGSWGCAEAELTFAFIDGDIVRGYIKGTVDGGFVVIEDSYRVRLSSVKDAALIKRAKPRFVPPKTEATLIKVDDRVYYVCDGYCWRSVFTGAVLGIDHFDGWNTVTVEFTPGAAGG